ncbi:MAG: Selenophosphate synthase SelD [Nitrospirae bacterium]|nr:MAG: Selenophosphate synthase SelD [Nitrospirota bacterium]
MVDDPFTFGAISAANAVSDVYAMGGKPLTALAIAGYPACSCEPQILREILRGATATLKEADALLVGGHSFDDSEIKFGLAVTGTGDPEQILRVRGARPGDILILTKPLGIGIITTALKGGKAQPAHVEEAVRWMLTLNRRASECALQAHASACTDVTGFGLLGHAHTMVRKSSVDFVICADSVPVIPAAWMLIDGGMVAEGAYKNLSYLASKTSFAEAIADEMKLMLADPQTSGGLLIAASETALPLFVAAGVFHAVIGSVTEGTGRIRVIP